MASLYGTNINTSKGIVKAKVETLVFEKDGMVMIYSPSFNLIAQGNTKEKALHEFHSTFCFYIKFCIENGTLKDDLEKNGWQVTDDGKFKEPSRDWMKENNDIYMDIIEKENFSLENIYCNYAA